VLGYTDTAPDPRSTPPDDPRLRTYESVLDGFSAPSPVTEHDPSWQAYLRAQGYEVPEDFWSLYAPAPGWVTPAGRGTSWAPTAIPAEHSETSYLTTAALEHLEGRTEPWLLHLSYLRPHPPWRAPEGYHDLVDPADVPAPVRHATRDVEGAQHPFLVGAMSVPAARAPDDELEMRQLAATYFGLMRHVDDELGRLLAGLRGRGQLDDTLIVITSDHGEQLGDHWLLEKLGWFDASYAIPLVIVDPRAAGAHRGTRIDAPTENVDVLPTVLSWMGADRPSQCDGRSLLPFVHGAAPEAWRSAVHWEYDYRLPRHPGVLGMRLNECSLVVVRSGTEKYVHHAAMPPVYYDLAEDPGELRDRAADPARGDRVRELAQELVTWRLRTEHDVLANTIVGEWGVHAADDRLR
jgi:arylsulfatase A-like enzyme